MISLCSRSRHMVVSCGQENEVRINYVSILTGKTKLWFSSVHNSVVFYLIIPKGAVEVPAYKRRLHQIWRKLREAFLRYEWANFEVFFLFFFVFLHTWKNRCNSQTYTSIQLKFGTLVGRQKAIITINFGENPFKILRVIINHLCKAKAIFRHA